MTPAQARHYRFASATLCAAFALVGTAFLLVPGRLLAQFDTWSRLAGLASSPAVGDPGQLYVVLAVAYMYLVTVLAWAMYRHPADPAPARLLFQAKLASSLLSFGTFFLRAPLLVLLLNGLVDGALAGLVLLLLRSSANPAAELPR